MAVYQAKGIVTASLAMHAQSSCVVARQVLVGLERQIASAVGFISA